MNSSSVTSSMRNLPEVSSNFLNSCPTTAIRSSVSLAPSLLIHSWILMLRFHWKANRTKISAHDSSSRAIWSRKPNWMNAGTERAHLTEWYNKRVADSYSPKRECEVKDTLYPILSKNRNENYLIGRTPNKKFVTFARRKISPNKSKSVFSSSTSELKRIAIASHLDNLWLPCWATLCRAKFSSGELFVGRNFQYFLENSSLLPDKVSPDKVTNFGIWITLIDRAILYDSFQN